MIYIIDAILAIKPNIGVTVRNEDIDNIVWDDANDIISKEDILAKKTELETAYTNKEYQRKRATAYPSIQDQLDDIYHNGIDAWKATIKTTKDKYPK
jgi:hypothetical protein